MKPKTYGHSKTVVPMQPKVTTLPEYTCQYSDCKHVWTPRVSGKLPDECPKCKRREWWIGDRTVPAESR